MGINHREKPLTGWRLMLGWAGIIAFLILLGMGYANWMNDLELKLCAGRYNTPQCDADRKAEKERAYERAKAES